MTRPHRSSALSVRLKFCWRCANIHPKIAELFTASASSGGIAGSSRARILAAAIEARFGYRSRERPEISQSAGGCKLVFNDRAARVSAAAQIACLASARWRPSSSRVRLPSRQTISHPTVRPRRWPAKGDGEQYPPQRPTASRTRHRTHRRSPGMRADSSAGLLRVLDARALANPVAGLSVWTEVGRRSSRCR